MILTIERNLFHKDRTFGIFYSDSPKWNFNLLTLEDTDRDINNMMSVKTILKNKIKGSTAIPYTSDVIYEMAHTWSNRFEKLMPLVMNVPAFDGIRIHAGRTEKNTEGCPLVGSEIAADHSGFVAGNSFEVFSEWKQQFAYYILREKIFLRVVKSKDIVTS